MKTRIVFMGSPEFSVPSLRVIAQNYEVVGVVTQPDRPAGRGRRLTPPPVKALAQELSLPFSQPSTLRQAQAMEKLRAWKPDLIVVAAFGQILRPEILDLPLKGCINVHASLLPRWRGAAPVQAAILHGDTWTGATIMRMDAGVDTGPLLNMRSTPILKDDTAGSLSERLAELGAELLLETLERYLKDKITPHPQDEANATYAPMLKKADGELDFRQPANHLALRVRAFNPWPGAFTTWDGERLKIQQAFAAQPKELKSPPKPGALTVHQGLPAIGTTQGLLVLEELQPAGKGSMSGKKFLQGARNWN